MRFAISMPILFSRAAAFVVPLLAAVALSLTACKPQDTLSTDQDGPTRQRNTLAVGLATVPSPFTDAQYVAGLNTPVAMEFAPDGRLFVCEKGGSLRVVKNGVLQATPFLSVSVNGAGERGLLGVAFDPNFATEKWVYVYYTAPSPNIHNRVSRFMVSSTNPDMSTGTEQVLFNLTDLGTAAIHNGGAIHFGSDAKLYIATGENSVPANAQNLGTQLGKLLRINKDGSIPTDNPFYTTALNNNRAIWAYGFRNPFTFAVQPGTGRIFVNDVGQDSYEEVNELLKGLNYGWPTTEGPTSDTRFRGPVHGYVNEGTNCSIIGAAFYNPTTQLFPSTYTGDFFYGDWCGGYIKSWDPASNAVTNLATGVVDLVDIKVGNDGALYYAQIGGSIRKIGVSGGTPPNITTHPASRTVGVGQSVSFTVVASGASLTYQWQRNGANISGATSATYILANPQTTDNNARFRAIVTNPQGNANSNEAVLTINSNRAPVPTITAPATGSTYRGGVAFNFAGSATDPDQGTLPASAFTWKVDFHHDAHNHPALVPTSGIMSGTFLPADRGETSSNVYYKVTLTVTDASGWAVTVFQDVLPVKANITLATNPPGLQLRLDGTAVTTPHTFTGVAGIIRSIEAVSPQTSGGQNYAFTTWSDGGVRIHDISTPATATTFTATFGASSWNSQDIGAVGPAGSFSVSGAIHSITGSGADIWDAADAFRYAYQTLNGDGQITARLNSLTNTDPWAKAGVMVRDGLAAGARHAFMAVTTGNGVAFQRREATNGQSLHTGVTGGFPHWVRMVRAGNSLRGYRSTDGATWTLVGESIQTLPTSILIGLAITSHNNAVLSTGAFDNVSLVSGPPPVTWTAQDVGAVGLAGSTTGTGTLTVKGSGADIYGTADGFHYFHRSLNADGEIRARLSSMTNTDQWAKAGVMIRENTAAGSRHVYMGSSPTNGLEFVRREVTNGTTIPVGTPGGAPRWVRVTRAGNVFTAYNSADGTSWTQVGTATVVMGADVRVGLAVCSHNNAVLNTAVFDNVVVTD